MRYSGVHWMSPPVLDPNEAREEAWRAWLDESMPGESGFRFAWDARGRYDEQRIAELEAALSDLVQAVEGEHNDGVRVPRSIRMNAMLRAANRALGQSEEVKQ